MLNGEAKHPLGMARRPARGKPEKKKDREGGVQKARTRTHIPKIQIEG